MHRFTVEPGDRSNLGVVIQRTKWGSQLEVEEGRRARYEGRAWQMWASFRRDS